ncbi:hypothetical protein EDF60_1668 [Leucobacter luti]|nr:hypothetical protein [Leucobacter luti]TCK41242.1 hypothetical protein EDF60_1668 [Leucobacter luti]
MLKIPAMRAVRAGPVGKGVGFSVVMCSSSVGAADL